MIIFMAMMVRMLIMIMKAMTMIVLIILRLMAVVLVKDPPRTKSADLLNIVQKEGRGGVNSFLNNVQKYYGFVSRGHPLQY